MDMNFNAYLLAALTGAAVMFWQHLRNFGTSITRQFIHTHDVVNGIEAIEVSAKLWNYLEKHCRPILDFSLPNLVSRFSYVPRINKQEIIVATIKTKPGTVLYKTPFGYVWVCREGSQLRWIRGLFDCQKFMIAISKFEIESVDGISGSGTSRLATITPLVGTRQRMKSMFGPNQRDNRNHAQADYNNGDEGHSSTSGGHLRASTSYEIMFSMPSLSKLLTHSYDDFKPDDEAIELIVQDDPLSIVDRSVKTWLDGKSWYRKRHIPWRYGLLLYGFPGTGKTNSVRYISSKYNMPVYSFDLASMTSDDFNRHWQNTASNASSSATGSIALFEDFDSTIVGRKNVIDAEMGVTFDIILNAIDGIKSNDGLLLVITTNKFESVDAALSMRPGRIEKAIKFELPDAEWRRKCLNKILNDWPKIVDILVKLTERATHTTVIQTAIPVGLYMASKAKEGEQIELTTEIINNVYTIAREMNQVNDQAIAAWSAMTSDKGDKNED